MSESFEIVQGRTATHGLSRFGLVNVFDDRDVRLSVWNDDDKHWLAKLRLKVSDVFPVPAGFVRVQAIESAEGRAKVSFADFAAAGIPAPESGSLLLVEGGELNVGDDTMRITSLGPDEVVLESWPKRFPADVVEKELVAEHRLKAGDELEVADVALKLIRLQAEAGEMLGFAEFARSRP